MPQKVKRKYGLPWTGFTSSVAAHQAAPDKAVGVGGATLWSKNLLFDPMEGKFFRRAGSVPIGGTSGILEAGSVSPRARKVIELDSPSLLAVVKQGAGGDSYPTHCVLYTRELTNADNPQAVHPESQLYLRSTIGSINYVLGQEFSTNHYPGTTSQTMNIKCMPYYGTLDSSETGYLNWGRLNSLATRRLAFAGSRGMLDVSGQVHFPNLYSTPMRWNKRYNESTASGSQNLRLWHTGPIPPLKMPTVATGTANASGVWQNGDLFFTSVAYQFEDGSVSAPMIPREINTELPTGLGRVSLGASCNFITWSGIPIGPYNVVGRWLLRSPKFNAAAGGSVSPSIQELRVTHYMANNTQTTYVDTNGNDLGLSDRPDVVRFDRIMPPSARYIGNFDGRVIVGYTLPHFASLYLCPDVNAGDEDTALITDSYEFQAANLTLKKNGSAGTAISTAGTLQQTVDLINATVAGGSGGKWWAQLAPGADGSGPSGGMTLFGDSGDTAQHIRSFGTSYPAAAFFASLRFIPDSASGGVLKAYKGRWFFTEGGPGLPSNLADSYIAGNYRTGLESWGILMGFAPLLDGCLIFFSKAVVLFRNTKSGRSGLDDDYHPDDLFTNIGCIAWDSIAWGDGWAGCLTEQGYMVFDGTRGGIANISGDVWNPATQTGEWAYEIAQCSAATSADNDGAHFHAKVMGGRLYVTYRSDSGAAGGIANRMLVYDFSLSSAGAGLAEVLRQDGSPWGWSTPMALTLSVLGEVRKSTGVARYGTIETAPADVVVTNVNVTIGLPTVQSAAGFGAVVVGMAVSGTNIPINTYVLIKTDSSNLTLTRNATATGVVTLTFGGIAGRVDQFETGTDDNGSAIASERWTARDFAGSMKNKAVQEVVQVYKKGATGLTLRGYRDGLGTTADATITLPSTAANNFDLTPLPMPQSMRSGARSIQFRLSDDGTSAAPEDWGIEADVIISDSYI
jgi:hypothetical protein